jgi:hypothetical protein
VGVAETVGVTGEGLDDPVGAFRTGVGNAGVQKARISESVFEK